MYSMKKYRDDTTVCGTFFFFEVVTGKCARECVSDCVKGYRMEEGRRA